MRYYSLVFFVSCDDGKIYDEGKHVEIEGGIARITATIQGVQTWPAIIRLLSPDLKG